MTESSAPAESQSKYQVRFDREIDGLERVAHDVDVLLWVDALGLHAALEPSILEATSALVVATGLPTRTAAARWAYDEQVRRGERVSIAVVAGSGGADDTLAAGAVIDALGDLGIDFTSPEAAVVAASWTGLRRAAGHLFTASVAGQGLVAEGQRERVAAAARADVDGADLRVLRGTPWT